MILAKDIIQDGNPILRENSSKVHFPLNKSEQHLGRELIQYLVIGQKTELAKKYNIMGGVGIAAPQVGINKMIIAVLVPNKSNKNAKEPLLKAIMINPVITSHSKQKCSLITGEGCLSVGVDIPGLVHRFKKVTINYQDINGKHHILHLSGYPAIVCQHEIDHLHGYLFYDHINKQDRYKKIKHETVIDFSQNTDKEFGAKDLTNNSNSYRAKRIKSYKRNESRTKNNVIKENR